jgi:hypothetical protein
MKKYFLIALATCVFSCNTKKDSETPKEEVSQEGTTNVKYQGEEPTTPEATEVYEPVPPKVTQDENGVPSDAIVLFNGTNLDEWISATDSTAAKWTINKDGSMTVKDKSGFIQTKRNFGSIQLHLEWKSPVDILNEGQARANSGVFIQQRYEVQILDNNDNPTYTNGQVGAVYKQSIPAAMASVPTGEWNSYDIIFHAPEFKGEELSKPAFITVLHNGVLIQDHFQIEGTIKYIGWPNYEAHGKAPIQLQDHMDNSRVSFRNIWVREL